MEDSAELLQEIEAAFAGVTREGGVSWRETSVVDDRGSMEERLAARALDTDRNWREVADNPPWRGTWGSFSFLDAIGFRYYLAAAMYRMVRQTEPEDYEISLEFHLKLPAIFLRKFTLDQWSLLDERQRRSVARFVKRMVVEEEDDAIDGWQDAYDSYWHSLID